ncbi:hypothetical protein PMIN03_012117 [Paraphaeosphaeria minitans]
MPKQHTEKRVTEASTSYSRNDNEAPFSNKTDGSKVSSIGNAGDEGLLVALMVLDIPDEIAEEAVTVSFEAEATPMEDEVDDGTVEEVRTEPGNPDETMLVYLIVVCNRPRPGYCTSSAKAMGCQI